MSVAVIFLLCSALRGAPPDRPILFRPKIHGKSGRILIRDSGFNPTKSEVNVLRDVDIRIDLSKLPSITYQFSGIGPKDRLERFTAKGQYNADTLFTKADLELIKAGAAYLSVYPLRLEPKFISGNADIGIWLSRAGKGKSLDYSIDARLKPASVQLKGIRSPARGEP